MYSKTTYKIVYWMITVAFYARLSPWKWCKRKNRLTRIPYAQMVRLQNNYIVHITCRIALIIYLIGTMWFLNIPTQEVIFGVALICCLVFTIVCLAVMYKRSRMHELRRLINAVLKFNDYHSKFYIKFK